jgi:two-component system, cell cycle sensor histidine kinase and response regulator CckA
MMGDGELAKSLQARFLHMKVLFSSGYTDDSVVRHGILKEEVAFLQKPYSPQALLRKVRQVLEQK